MPSEPVDIARRGHQYYMWLRNSDTYPGVSEIYVDRVQNVEAAETIRQDKTYELGRKGPVGASEDAPDFRITWEENWVKWESALYQAGKDPDSDTSFNLGDILDNDDVVIYLASSKDDGTFTHEYVFDQSSLAEMTMTWRIGQPITIRYVREAINGKIYRQGGLTHTSRGTLDDSSDGSINPKDARIFFYTSGCTPDASDRVYRLQGFDISARFPLYSVREIGRRDKVGTLSDTPDVTCTLDVQPGDDQPMDRFFTDQTTYLDLNQLQNKDALIRIYDPDANEASSVLGAIELQGLRSSGATPVRAQVRGLATSRITLEVVDESTADSGGFIGYVGDKP